MLRAPNTNQIKVAYHLCRDYHCTLNMMSDMLSDMDDEPAPSTSSSSPGGPPS